MCPEDNREIIVREFLSGSFKNIAAFAMPACNASIRVVFDHVSDVPLNAWIWSSGIGILQIVGFNPKTSEIELKNICPQDECSGAQAVPGTPIPACTVWMLAMPRCPGASQGPAVTFPYLALAFTAPAASTCLDITVTNTNGLAVNKEVSIAGGVYRISAVKSSTLITVCNDGAGVTPGTGIDATDGAGTFIVPITLLDTNPCTGTAVNSGKILVCKDGVTQPLAGTLTGQVAVWDQGSGEASFESIAIPTLDCTTLIDSLTLDPALPHGTAYLITVVDSSEFVADQPVVIGATKFTIASIVDGTHIRVVPDADPIAILTFAAGSSFCSATCCDVLNDLVTRVYLGEFMWGGVSTNATNSQYDITLPSQIATEPDGLFIGFKAHKTNTAGFAALLKVNAIGYVNIVRPDGVTGVYPGEIVSGRHYWGVMHNGVFVVLSPLGGGANFWTPTITTNGAGTVGSVTFQANDYSLKDPYVEFELSLTGTIASTNGATTEILIPAPLAGIAHSTCEFICHAIENNAAIAAHVLWRYDGTNLLVFKEGLAAWLNGTLRIHIQGRYRLL